MRLHHDVAFAKASVNLTYNQRRKGGVSAGLFIYTLRDTASIMISLSFSVLLAVFLSLDALFWCVSATIESVQLRPRDMVSLEWTLHRHYVYILKSRGGSSSSVAEEATVKYGSSLNTSEQQQIEIPSKSDIVRSDKSKNIFSLFQVGDGSEADPDSLPDRYLRMQLGRRADAKKAVQATLAWRKEHDIDHILLRPQPKFNICKAVFPHCFVGRDKEGHVILLQRPALIDIPKAKTNDLSNEDLLMHYVFVNEYLWQILESTDALGTMTSIIDLRGLNFSVLKKTDLIGFCKVFISTMDAHYPQRAFKTLIINAPKWFNALYKLFSPLLRESTKSKIFILSRGPKQDEVLMELLDNAKLVFPPSVWSDHKESKKRKHHKRHAKENEEGGDDEDAADMPLADGSWKCESDMEKELHDYVMARLDAAGEVMLQVE